MTLDYTKMFLIVTEEAVVKGRFAFIQRAANHHCPAPLGIVTGSHMNLLVCAR